MLEQVDQFVICGREGERTQIGAMNPPHFLSEHGTRVSDQFAFDEVQLDDPLRICVLGRQDLSPSMDGGIEFLADFPSKAVGERLPCVALSPGEFPITFEMYPTLPPGDEKRVAPPDHRRGDEDARRVI